MSEEKSFLVSIVESSDDAIIGLSVDGTIILWNRGAEVIYGYRREEVRGLPISVLSLPERSDEVIQFLEKIRRGEHIRHFETMHLRKDGRVIFVSLALSPVLDDAGTIAGASLISRDVTLRIRTNEAIREAEEKYRLLFSAEKDAIILFDAESLEVSDFNEAALQLYGYRGDEFRRMTFPDLCAEGGSVSERLGEILSSRIERIPRAMQQRADGSRFPAEISVSNFLWRGRQMLVAIVRDTTERVQIEEVHRSLGVAREIQQQLLPRRAPRLEGFDLYARTVYCEETGGDYYDFICDDAEKEPRLGFLVGDVSGHGIASALLMAMTKGMIHVEGEHCGNDLSRLFNVLNRYIFRFIGDANFLTLFYGTIDPGSRALHWASAGHGPVFWFRKGRGEVSELATTGPPLGIVEEASYETCGPVTLEEGDVLLVGTDGLWEARNRGGEMFGVRRIRQVLATWVDHPARDIYAAIMEKVSHFTGGSGAQDDMTLLVIKSLPPDS